MYRLTKDGNLSVLLGLTLLTGLLLSGSLAVNGQEAGYMDGRLEVRLNEWTLGFDEAVVNRTELADSTTIGAELPIHVVNGGSYEHNFAIKIETARGEYYVRTKILEPGEETTFAVSLPTGEYELYCSLEGHAEQGMEGTLVIQEGAETEDMGQEEEEEDDGYDY
jgi:hypothetical protein